METIRKLDGSFISSSVHGSSGNNNDNDTNKSSSVDLQWMNHIGNNNNNNTDTINHDDDTTTFKYDENETNNDENLYSLQAFRERLDNITESFNHQLMNNNNDNVVNNLDRKSSTSSSSISNSITASLSPTKYNIDSIKSTPPIIRKIIPTTTTRIIHNNNSNNDDDDDDEDANQTIQQQQHVPIVSKSPEPPTPVKTPIRSTMYQYTGGGGVSSNNYYQNNHTNTNTGTDSSSRHNISTTTNTTTPERKHNIIINTTTGNDTTTIGSHLNQNRNDVTNNTYTMSSPLTSPYLMNSFPSVTTQPRHVLSPTTTTMNQPKTTAAFGLHTERNNNNKQNNNITTPQQDPFHINISNSQNNNNINDDDNNHHHRILKLLQHHEQRIYQLEYDNQLLKQQIQQLQSQILQINGSKKHDSNEQQVPLPSSSFLSNMNDTQQHQQNSNIDKYVDTRSRHRTSPYIHQPHSTTNSNIPQPDHTIRTTTQQQQRQHSTTTVVDSINNFNSPGTRFVNEFVQLMDLPNDIQISLSQIMDQQLHRF